MEFKYILSRKRPFSRFMHSLCKNENIPMWGSTLPHNKRNCFPPYSDHYLSFTSCDFRADSTFADNNNTVYDTTF